MKSKQRGRIAMSNGMPDRVPVIPQLCPPHAIRMLGLDYEQTILNVIREQGPMCSLDFEAQHDVNWKLRLQHRPLLVRRASAFTLRFTTGTTTLPAVRLEHEVLLDVTLASARHGRVIGIASKSAGQLDFADF